MITAYEYIRLDKVYSEKVDKASKALKKVTQGNRNEMGLVNDETKNSKEYKAARQAYNKAFQLRREFAKSVPNDVKRKAGKIRRQQMIDN